MKTWVSFSWRRVALCIHKTAMLMTLFSFFTFGSMAQISVNTTGNPPDPSSMMDVTATGKGVLIPRMTLSQRPVSPAVGLLIYQTDVSPGYYFYDGSAWQRIGLAVNDRWILNGNDIFYNAGKVSIGLTTSDSHGLNVANNIGNKAAIHGVSMVSNIIFAQGFLGVLTPTGFGLPITVTDIGVLGIKTATGNSGAAVYGLNPDNSTLNFGGIFATNGKFSPAAGPTTNYGMVAYGDSGFYNYGIYTRGTAGSVNYGIYSQAEKGYTNYSGYFNVPMSTGINYGGYFKTTGVSGSGTNYATYSDARNGATNYAGYMKGRLYVEGHATSNDAADYLSPVLSVHVIHNQTSDSKAIEAYSVPQPGFGAGVAGTGGSSGVYGYSPASTFGGVSSGVYGTADGTGSGPNGIRIGVYGNVTGTGKTYGVYGRSDGSSGERYGVSGTATGNGTGTRIGLYGVAYGGETNWAAFLDGSTYITTDLRIGTTTAATGYALSVNGKIACTEVLVRSMSGWPDYVFSENYRLPDLNDLERSIRKEKHLPGIPSSTEVDANGVNLGDMEKCLLEKVEELTLHLIKQNKEIEALKEEIKQMKKENAAGKKGDSEQQF